MLQKVRVSNTLDINVLLKQDPLLTQELAKRPDLFVPMESNFVLEEYPLNFDKESYGMFVQVYNGGYYASLAEMIKLRKKMNLVYDQSEILYLVKFVIQ